MAAPSRISSRPAPRSSSPKASTNRRVTARLRLGFLFDTFKATTEYRLEEIAGQITCPMLAFGTTRRAKFETMAVLEFSAAKRISCIYRIPVERQLDEYLCHMA